MLKKITMGLAVATFACASAVTSSAAARTLTLATTLSGGDISVEAMQHWAELLEQRSEADLALNIIPGGSLGGDRALLQQLSSGEIDLNLTSPVMLQHVAPQYQCLEAEYVYRGEAHGFSVWRGEVGEEVSRTIRENYGIEIAGVGRRGARHVTANHPVRQPSDLEGVKMRVTNNLRASVFETYGALPAPLSLSELYGALRQGVFEAQENPLATIYSNRFHEVQDYINLTQHVWTYNIVAANSAMLDSLNDTQRQAFDETLQETMTWLYDAVGEANQRIRDELTSEGAVEFIEPDVAAFREQARPILEQFAEENCRKGLLADIDAVESNSAAAR